MTLTYMPDDVDIDTEHLRWIAERVKFARENHPDDLSIRGAAKRAKMAAGTWSKVEAGIPTDSMTLRRVERALGMGHRFLDKKKTSLGNPEGLPSDATAIEISNVSEAQTRLQLARRDMAARGDTYWADRLKFAYDELAARIESYANAKD